VEQAAKDRLAQNVRDARSEVQANAKNIRAAQKLAEVRELMAQSEKNASDGVTRITSSQPKIISEISKPIESTKPQSAQIKQPAVVDISEIMAKAQQAGIRRITQFEKSISSVSIVSDELRKSIGSVKDSLGQFNIRTNSLTNSLQKVDASKVERSIDIFSSLIDKQSSTLGKVRNRQEELSQTISRLTTSLDKTPLEQLGGTLRQIKDAEAKKLVLSNRENELLSSIDRLTSGREKAISKLNEINKKQAVLSQNINNALGKTKDKIEETINKPNISLSAVSSGFNRFIIQRQQALSESLNRLIPTESITTSGLKSAINNAQNAINKGAVEINLLGGFFRAGIQGLSFELKTLQGQLKKQEAPLDVLKNSSRELSSEINRVKGQLRTSTEDQQTGLLKRLEVLNFKRAEVESRILQQTKKIETTKTLILQQEERLVNALNKQVSNAEKVALRQPTTSRETTPSKEKRTNFSQLKNETQVNNENIEATRKLTKVRKLVAQGEISAADALKALKGIRVAGGGTEALEGALRAQLDVTKNKLRKISSRVDAEKNNKLQLIENDIQRGVVDKLALLRQETDKSVNLRKIFNARLQESLAARPESGVQQAVPVGRLTAVAKGLEGTELKQFAGAAQDAFRATERLAARQSTLVQRFRELRQESRNTIGGFIRNRNEMNALRKEARALGIDLKSSLGESSDLVAAFGNQIGTVAKRFILFQVVSRAIFAVGGAIRSLITDIIELDTVARRLTVFRDFSQQIDTNPLTRFESLTKASSNALTELIRTSKQTGLTFKEISDALLTTERVGRAGNKAFADAVIALVRLEGGTLSAETATTNLNAIAIQFLDNLAQYTPAVKEATNATERLAAQQSFVGEATANAAALIGVLASQSSASVESLTSALTRVGAAAAGIQGADLPTTAALLSKAFSATGANAGRLATALRQVLTQSAKNADQIKTITGVNITDFSGQIRGFDAILDVLDRINQAGRTARGVQIASLIGDRRNVGDIFALAAGAKELRKEFDTFGKNAVSLKRVTDAVGSSFDANALLANSLQSSINKLRASFDLLFTGGTLEGFIKSSIDGLTSFIDTLNTLSDSPAFTIIKVSFQSIGAIIEGIGATLSTIFAPIPALAEQVAIALGKIGVFQDVTGTNTSRNLGNLEEETREIDRQAKIVKARRVEIDRQVAAEEKAKEEARLHADTIKLQTTLVDKFVSSQENLLRNLNNESFLQNDILNSVRLGQELQAAGIKNSELVKKIAAERAAEETKIAIQLTQQNANLAKTKGLSTALLATASKSATIDIKFAVDKEELKRQLGEAQSTLKRLQEVRPTTFTQEEAKKAILAVIDGQRKVNDLSRQMLERELKVTQDRGTLLTQQAQEQVGLFQRAGQELTGAFDKILGAQQNIIRLLGEQGEITSEQLKNGAQLIRDALEKSGASLRARFLNILNTSRAQIQLVRNVQQEQLALLRQAPGGGAFTGAAELSGAAQNLIKIITSTTQTGLQRSFQQQENFARDVRNAQLNAVRQNAIAEFQLRINATKQEIDVRKKTLQDEIRIINERINAERQLQELRIQQQREFGKLLLESPEKFKQTLDDIALARQFFKNITDVNINSLTTLSKRIASTRERGGEDILRRVQAGLEAAARFGQRPVVGGVGGTELQSVFERLQIATPAEVTKSLSDAARAQEEIRQRQEEIRRLNALSIQLEQAQVNIARATADLATKQRGEINASLQTLIANNATNFAALLKAQQSLQTFATRGQPATRATTELTDRATKEFNNALNEAARQRQTAEKKFADITKETAKITLGASKPVAANIDSTKTITREQLKAATAAAQTAAKVTTFGTSVQQVVNSLTNLTDSNALLNATVIAQSKTISSTPNIGVEVQKVFGNLISPRTATPGGGVAFRPERFFRSDKLNQSLDELEATVRRTGGSPLQRAERDRLRRAQQRARLFSENIPGGEGARRLAVRRGLRVPDIRGEIEGNVRLLLNGASDFVERFRQLRGRGELGRRAFTQGNVEETKRLLESAGFGDLAKTLKTREEGINVLDKFLRLSEELNKNQQDFTKRAENILIELLAKQLQAAEKTGARIEKAVTAKPAPGVAGAAPQVPGVAAVITDPNVLTNNISNAVARTFNEGVVERVAAKLVEAISNAQQNSVIVDNLANVSSLLAQGVQVAFASPVSLQIEAQVQQNIVGSEELIRTLSDILGNKVNREELETLRLAIAKLINTERTRGTQGLPLGGFSTPTPG